jgi:uncharacterized protein (TIRG00374 family)
MVYGHALGETTMRRTVWISVQLAVSAGLIAYLLWQIDIGATGEHIASSDPLYVVAAAAVFAAALVPMAWRWQVLLASKGVREPLRWLTKLYFIGYAASQVLPTGIGGDAVRIVEHARRRSKRRAEVAGAVLMERVVGLAGVLLVVAAGLAIAGARHDDVGGLLWVELACVAAVAAAGVLVFSRTANAVLQEHIFPRAGAVRLHRPLSSVWIALHGYRLQSGPLLSALGASVVVQFLRTVSIWLCGEAVGLDISPVVYLILGPVLFLVMMIPITVNGLGVRESFFVLFLGRFGVHPEAAFAAGFLFFAVMIATAFPGGLILAWRSVRGGLIAAKSEASAPVETT